MSKRAHMRLQWNLATLSKRATRQSGKLVVHTYSFPDHIPPPYNAVMNLARFFASSHPVVVAPSLSTVAALSIRRQVLEEGVASALNGTIPVLFFVQRPSSDSTSSLGPPTPDATLTVGSKALDPSSAILLVDGDHGFWCPDRFLSRPTTQWTECLWHAWLLSRGAFQLVEYDVDVLSGNRTDGEESKTKIEILVSFTDIF
ncbi:hypothetical protein CPB86DRAFT_789419 [Serendipita vermifera]|nr:hypothetical protein CPB86DRAFT_789419 [Serendipita vermifera]